MIYLILGVVFVALIGGVGWKIEHNGYTRGAASCLEKTLAAQKKAEEEGKKREEEARLFLEEKNKVFAAGEAKQRARQLSNEQRGAQSVATSPVFKNPNCKLDADSLRTLNDSRANLRTAPDSTKSTSTVPGARTFK